MTANLRPPGLLPQISTANGANQVDLDQKNQAAGVQFNPKSYASLWIG
jgi:hypothetical protein